MEVWGDDGGMEGMMEVWEGMMEVWEGMVEGL